MSFRPVGAMVWRRVGPIYLLLKQFRSWALQPIEWFLLLSHRWIECGLLLWRAFNASEVNQVKHKSCLNAKLMGDIKELQRQIKCTQCYIAPTHNAILTKVYFGGWSSWWNLPSIGDGIDYDLQVVLIVIIRVSCRWLHSGFARPWHDIAGNQKFPDRALQTIGRYSLTLVLRSYSKDIIHIIQSRRFSDEKRSGS